GENRLVEQELSQVGGSYVVLRIGCEQAVIEFLTFIKLFVRQLGLAGGRQAPCELSEQFAAVRIFGRGPRPVGRGSIPVFQGLVSAGPLRKQIAVGRLGGDGAAVDGDRAGPVFLFVLPLGEQIADKAGGSGLPI